MSRGKLRIFQKNAARGGETEQEQVCKPGSVENCHLSARRVAAALVPPMRTVIGPIGRICGVASDRVYSAPALPRDRVSSYLAFPPLPAEAGGISLLYSPGSRLRRTLSVILPCEARTFLIIIPFGVILRERAAALR